MTPSFNAGQRNAGQLSGGQFDGAQFNGRPAEDLVAQVRERLVGQVGVPSAEDVARTLRELGTPVDHSVVLATHEQLRQEVVGLGPLEPLLGESGLTDVLVVGCDQVFVDCGNGLEPRAITFVDAAAVRRLAVRLAAQGGRRLDDSAPYADAQLASGIRFHAVLAPVAQPGTVISLRVPPGKALTLENLIERGSLSEFGADLMRQLIAAKRAFLISGGTGSGKTTLLACLLSQVSSHERIVVVEDSRELHPEHPHLVSLQARLPNQEGHGAIELGTLVRQALRMRPDRLVVGEVRGAEVVDLMAALNTGHQGGCGTLHANSASDVPARIEALALAAGLPRPAVHAQLGAAFDVVVHIDRRAGTRQIREISVTHFDADHHVTLQPAVRFETNLEHHLGPGFGRLGELLTSGHK
jgi:pilus assembly protein CpaF